MSLLCNQQIDHALSYYVRPAVYEFAESAELRHQEDIGFIGLGTVARSKCVSVDELLK
jgi:hypothetical protein